MSATPAAQHGRPAGSPSAPGQGPGPGPASSKGRISGQPQSALPWPPGRGFQCTQEVQNRVTTGHVKITILGISKGKETLVHGVLGDLWPLQTACGPLAAADAQSPASASAVPAAWTGVPRPGLPDHSARKSIPRQSPSPQRIHRSALKRPARPPTRGPLPGLEAGLVIPSLVQCLVQSGPSTTGWVSRTLESQGPRR